MDYYKPTPSRVSPNESLSRNYDFCKIAETPPFLQKPPQKQRFLQGFCTFRGGFCKSTEVSAGFLQGFCRFLQGFCTVSALFPQLIHNPLGCSRNDLITQI